MLLRFIARNFLSINDDIDLNMFPYNKLRSHKDHIYSTPQVSLLKSAAMYGANGAGKSNVIKGIRLLHDFVVLGDDLEPARRQHYFKLAPQNKSLPTHLEVEIFANGRYYSYGLEILNFKIVEEFLYELDIEGKDDQLVFKRFEKDGKTRIEVREEYRQTEKDRLRFEIYAEEMLSERSTLLKQMREKEKFTEVRDCFSWFLEKLYILHPNSKIASITKEFMSDAGFKSFMEDYLPRFGTGIKHIGLDKTPFEQYFLDKKDESISEMIKEQFEESLGEKEGAMLLRNEVDEFAITKDSGSLFVNKIVTKHGGDRDSPKFSLGEESDGTQRLFDLIPALRLLIEEDIVLFVDEMGRSLHSSLLKEFLRLFLELETKGQLIFSTHESHLLDTDLFRQDEIWFVEKDESGASKLYPLSEFKVRKDLDVQKGYLNGRFGAIPFLGNLEKFFNQEKVNA